LLAPLTAFGLWSWLRDGTASDPANVLLLVAAVLGVLVFGPIRRYWHVRNTSRSRRDSSLFV
jgi:hypothetical protein